MKRRQILLSTLQWRRRRGPCSGWEPFLWVHGCTGLFQLNRIISYIYTVLHCFLHLILHFKEGKVSLSNGRIKSRFFQFQIGAFPTAVHTAFPRWPEASLLPLSQSNSYRMFSFSCQEASYFIIPSSLSQGEIPLAFEGLAIFSVSLDHSPARPFSSCR